MPFATKHSSHLVGAIVFAFIMVCSGNAAQTAEMTPANIRLDFIIGGKHAPWYVALEKGFYAKRGLSATIQASTGSADTVRTVASVWLRRGDDSLARRRSDQKHQRPRRQIARDQPRPSPMVFDARVLPHQ